MQDPQGATKGEHFLGPFDRPKQSRPCATLRQANVVEVRAQRPDECEQQPYYSTEPADPVS